MKKQILLLFLSLSAVLVSAQVGGTQNTFNPPNYVPTVPTVPERAISFNLGYSIPTITNAQTNQDFWDRNLGMGLSFGVNYKHHFFRSNIINNIEVREPMLFGVGAGLGISHLAQQAVMNYDHTEIIHNFVDIDGDIADVTILYRGIRERVSLTYLDIPLYLEIGRPNQTRLSGFFNAGLRASILVSNQFSGEGTFTSTGFYRYIDGALANVNLYNIPVLNYFTNRDVYIDPEYDLSRFVLWGSLSGGINVPLRRNVSNLILRIGARVDYTLLPVSKGTAEPHFTGANFRPFSGCFAQNGMGNGTPNFFPFY